MRLTDALALRAAPLVLPRQPWNGRVPVARQFAQAASAPRVAPAPFGAAPAVALGKFRGTDDTIRLMLDYARGPEGEQNIKVRQWAEAIIRFLRPKDYLGEILAIRHWCTGAHLRYANDARHVEQVKSPFRTLTEVEQYGVANLDCDDYATLIATLGMTLGREARYTMVGYSAKGEFSHVFACLKEPRSGEWIICDPVAGTREYVMASTAKDFRHVSVDD